jgi:hypothetical protein
MTLEDLQADRLAVAMEAVRLYQQKQEEEKEFTVEEAATYCRVDENTVRRWANNPKKLLKDKQMKNGKQYTIKKTALDKMRKRS